MANERPERITYTRQVYDLIDAGELPAVRTEHGIQIPAAAITDRTS